MFERVSAALASGVISVAMLTTAAPAADAVERPTGVVLVDGSGDAWTLEVAAEGEEVAIRADVPAADVTRAFVRHGTYALKIRMRFADLRGVGSQFYDVQIGTPRNVYFAQVRSVPGSR